MALLHHLAITPPLWAAVLSTTVGIATPLLVDYLRIARAMGKRAPK